MQAKQEYTQVNDTILSQYLYLFIMDPVRIPYQSFEKYKQVEPGFEVPMLEAYIEAFQSKLDGKISHELIKKIHRTAMRHKPELSAEDYRLDSGNFIIAANCFSEQIIPTFSATDNGLIQFINKWINHSGPTTHALSFSKKEQVSGVGIVTINGTPQFSTFDNGKRNQVPFNEKIHMPIINRLFHDFNYQCTVDVMPITPEGIKVQKVVHQHIEVIISAYEKDKAQATSEDQLLFVICKYVQQIEQLHPFMDGNVRTSAILLNKLLRDHHLPLSLMLNPNRFDACSVAEVVAMVKDGQKIFQALVAKKTPSPFQINTSEELSELKSYIAPVNTINNPRINEAFIKVVIQGRPLHSTSAAQLDNLSLFGAKTNSEAQKLIGELGAKHAITTAIKANDMGLALRRACSSNNPSLVEKVLLLKEDWNTEINKQSSNGNTALDWFESHTEASIAKTRVHALLVSVGAKNQNALMDAPSKNS